MIPVGLRYWFGRGGVVDVNVDDEEEEGVVFTAAPEDEEEEDEILAVGPSRGVPKPGEQLDGDDSDEYEDDDDDLILEAGPAIPLLPKDDQQHTEGSARWA